MMFETLQQLKLRTKDQPPNEQYNGLFEGFTAVHDGRMGALFRLAFDVLRNGWFPLIRKSFLPI